MPISLSRVAAEARACTLCAKTLPFKPQPVFLAGRRARLLIVGQAPGRRVHESGIPWNDPSGDVLREWLALERAEFYDPSRIAIVPTALCYPGTLDGVDLPPCRECAPAWQPRFRAALPEVRLTLLVGSYAQAYYLGKKKKQSVGETVRAFREYLPEFFVLPHPSWRNKLWLKKIPGSPARSSRRCAGASRPASDRYNSRPPMKPAMKLLASLASPYTRKVRVVLAEKKIDCEMELVDVQPVDNAVNRHNPLGKIPTLVLDDGTALYDSRVIVEFLDNVSPISRLIPGNIRERVQVRRWEALADGVVDAGILVRGGFQLEKQLARMRRAMGQLAAELEGRSWCHGERYSLADIALGCCVGWLGFRKPGDIDWHAEYPALARHHQKLMERSAFADTVPQLLPNQTKS